VVVSFFFDLDDLQSVTKLTVFRYDIYNFTSKRVFENIITFVTRNSRESLHQEFDQREQGYIGGKRGGPVGIAEWSGIRPTAAYALQ
jgi:hypothetical protein